MSNYQLLLPKMGESVAEATIIKWLKNPGDYIEVDEAILEIATDKVDSEVPSPVAGKLTAQLYVVDDVVQVGSAIALIQTADSQTAAAPAQPAPAPVAQTQQAPAPQPAPAPQATPVQQAPPAVPVQQTAPAQPVQANNIPGITQLEQRPAASKPSQQSTEQSGRFYSPLVKSIAAQEGISLSELDVIPGTGAEGRLTKDDLLNYLQSRNFSVQEPASRPAPVSQRVQQPAQPAPVAAAQPEPQIRQQPQPEAPSPEIVTPQPKVTQQPLQQPQAAPQTVQQPQAAPQAQPVQTQSAPQPQQVQQPVAQPLQQAPQQVQPAPVAPPAQPAYAAPVQPAYQQQYMPPPPPPVYQQPPYVVYQQAPPIYMPPPSYPPVYYGTPPGYPPQQGQPGYPQQPSAPAPVPPAPTPEPVQPKLDAATSLSGDDEIIEMDRMRRLIADHMVNSKKVAPHVTSFIEVDVTNLVMWREKVKREFESREGEKLTFTPIFIEAVAKAINAMPMINVSVDGKKIIKHKNINIGMATALPSGNLIVPVIKRANDLSLSGIAKAVNDLADRARRNKLQPDEVKDGTFTITNVGTFGNVMGTPIINQPQVAILAIGAIKKKPAVVETKSGDVITIRHMMFLSLSYDHRVVDGSLGGSFIKRVSDYLESWDVNRDV